MQLYCIVAVVVALSGAAHQIAAAAPISLPNSTKSLLNKLARRCPRIAEPPTLQFAETPRVLSPVAVEAAAVPFVCSRVLECQVMGAPPETEVFWFANEKLIATSADRQLQVREDVLVKKAAESAWIGFTQTRYRLCADGFLGSQRPATEFKCRVQSPCHSELVVESEPMIVESRENQWYDIAEETTRSSPLITSLTSMRMETAGKMVEFVCEASGSPAPETRWLVVDANDESLLHPLDAFGFIRTTKTGVLIDTAALDPSIATITLQCTAANAVGTDTATSTLVLVDED